MEMVADCQRASRQSAGLVWFPETLIPRRLSRDDIHLDKPDGGRIERCHTGGRRGAFEIGQSAARVQRDPGGQHRASLRQGVCAQSSIGCCAIASVSFL